MVRVSPPIAAHVLKSPCQRNKIPRVFLLLLHQFSAIEDPRQMHIYLIENSVTPLTTWSHNFLHYSLGLVEVC